MTCYDKIVGCAAYSQYCEYQGATLDNRPIKEVCARTCKACTGRLSFSGFLFDSLFQSWFFFVQMNDSCAQIAPLFAKMVELVATSPIPWPQMDHTLDSNAIVRLVSTEIFANSVTTLERLSVKARTSFSSFFSPLENPCSPDPCSQDKECQRIGSLGYSCEGKF